MENAKDQAAALIQNLKTVLPAPEAYLSQFRARYMITSGSEYASRSRGIGNLKDCKFYVTDVTERDTHIAFRVAYDAAMQSKDNKELCASVGSMICDMFNGFEYTMETALNGIGIKTVYVSLPSQGREHNNIVQAKVTRMGWPSILVNFGCCIILIFKKIDEANYETFMSSCISELREIAGCDPDVDFGIPFDYPRATAIRTMLGSSSSLREDLILFLMSAVNRGEIGIGGVCRCLCELLAWSEMRHFTLINEELVKPRSPVLLDPRISLEVENYKEACAAVASHPCPQFFIHMALHLDLLKVDASRFPTLVAVALELERESKDGATVSNSESITTTGANPKTVQSLLKLHRAVMPEFTCVTDTEFERRKRSRSTVELD